MIRGVDTSGYGTNKLADAGVMMNGQNQLHFAITRGRDGYRDDDEYRVNEAQLVKVQTDFGAAIWGSYAFLAFYQAARGDDQAQDYWNLISAGGVQWQIPPALDAERHRYIDANGNVQYRPLPSVVTYMDTFLVPAIEMLSPKLNRRPIIYSNPDFILNYLKPALLLPKYAIVRECPLWLAAWTNDTAGPTYWEAVKVFWPRWAFWQYKGDIRDWPGVSDVDLNRYPGTRAQLKAWCLDANAEIPVYDPVYNPGDIVVPPPPPPPLPPDEPPSDLEARIKTIEDQLAAGLPVTGLAKL